MTHAATIATGVVLAFASAARADEPVREEILGTQPLALVGRGVSASYERRVAPRWSAVVLGGLRAAALEDYHSRTLDVGGEVRYWLRARTPMRGPFVALHASVAQTRLADDVMGHVGSSTALAQRVDLGWRFTIASRLALAPTLGLGAREDLDSTGRLATTVRPQLAIGFELGWLRR